MYNEFKTYKLFLHICNKGGQKAYTRLKMDKRENKNETVDFLENSTGINQSRSTDIFLSQLQIIKFNSF